MDWLGGDIVNTKLKAEIEKAIDDTIQNNAEENMWDGYIHNELAQQMANAAEAVFDAAMGAQKFAKNEAS